MSAILKSHNNIERKRQRTGLSLFFHMQEDIPIIWNGDTFLIGKGVFNQVKYKGILYSTFTFIRQ